MAVSPTREVNILPGTVSPGGTGVDFIGAFLTNDARIPPTAPRAFSTADDIGSWFGTTSAEYNMGVPYFAGVRNARRTPSAYYAIRVLDAASSGRIDGGGLGTMTLVQLKALTGTLIVAVGGTLFTSSSINLSAATSFANAAALMTAGFTAPTFTIGYDALRNAFFLTTTVTGTAATVSPMAGTLADGVKLSTTGGAYTQNGAAADTDWGAALDRAKNAAAPFVTYASALAYTDDQRMQLATWNKSKGGSYYVGFLHDTSAAALIPNNAAAFGNVVIAQEYDGIVPVYNSSVMAAAFQGYAAGLNMNAVQGRATLAYRKPVAAIPYTCTSTADYDALYSNGYSSYAQFEDGAISYNHFVNGAIGGQYRWIDTYLGQIYLRRLLTANTVAYMESVPLTPYTPAGYASLKQSWSPAWQAAKVSGIYQVNVTVNDLQAAAISAITGIDTGTIQSVLYTNGYLELVRDPANVADRVARKSPYCFACYTDGEAVQMVEMQAAAVL